MRTCIILLAVMFCAGTAAAETHIIAGAGPSTELASIFFEHFSKTPAAQGHTFEVTKKSIKHAGGLKHAETHLFGRTGKALNKKELAQGKQDIFLGGASIIMVRGASAGVDTISMEQLKGIVMGEITNWKQVGGADAEILWTGREGKSKTYSVIVDHYPFFAQAKFKRQFKKDDQMTNFIKSAEGAYGMGFGARSNYERKYHLNVSGFQVQNRLGLVIDEKHKTHPLVKAAIAYAQSPQWAQLATEYGFVKVPSREVYHP